MIATPTINLRLVSAPPPVRRCGFCNRTLTAVELWCDCPQWRLAKGLYQLRTGARRA